jgi:hypothetical protein
MRDTFTIHLPLVNEHPFTQLLVYVQSIYHLHCLTSQIYQKGELNQAQSLLSIGNGKGIQNTINLEKNVIKYNAMLI